jgi:hypothetical protein
MLNVTYNPIMHSVEMRSVFMLNVTYKPILLSVVMMNVVMLIIVAPF